MASEGKCKTACIGAPHAKLRLTIDEYDRKYGKNSNIKLYCPVCESQLFTHALSSPNMTSSFHHPKDSQCPLVIRQDSLFKNLGDEYIDESQAKKMRGDFFQEHTIKRAFAFISTLCGYGVLNAEKLKACLRIADAMNIWAYRNIEQWMIPYMLITLRDFEVPGKKYSWRFVLQKERGCPKPFWVHHDRCALLKVDSKSGNPLPASDNPLPFSEDRYKEKSSNTDWIYPELTRSIMATC